LHHGGLDVRHDGSLPFAFLSTCAKAPQPKRPNQSHPALIAISRAALRSSSLAQLQEYLDKVEQERQADAAMDKLMVSEAKIATSSD
jgi:hypothetical protein